MGFAKPSRRAVLFMHQGKIWEEGRAAETLSAPRTPELETFLNAVLALATRRTGMKDSDKERTKLSATFLSNLGLAVIVAGFVAPFATSDLQDPSTLPADWITTIFSLALAL